MSHWLVLAVLGLIGVFSILTANDQLGVVVLMVLSYFSNASYSMVSRSAVRDSALYHAFTLFLSNILFYSVLHKLVTADLTLALFMPYTVATVYGSFTGANASMKVERFFGITTSIEKKKPSPRSVLAQKVLLGFLGVLGLGVAVYSDNIVASFAIAGLVSVDNALFSLLRRSRNTSNTTYHVVVSVAKSAAWYMMYRYLALGGMTFALFLPYCFGSILGGLAGQEFSMRIERMIGASADAHLSSDSSIFIPWRTIALLAVIAGAFIAFSENYSFLILLTAFSAGQQVAFSMVSRSRNRNSMTYHVIASVFSNSVWFLTFRQLNIKDWEPELYVPFAAGAALGSVTGVGISMGIEKKLKITSDS